MNDLDQVPATKPPTTPSRFWLNRKDDESGVSGTGCVAEGVRFHDGRVVLVWTTARTSTAIYESMAMMIEVHGHNGKTVVEWHDKPPFAFERAQTTAVQDSFENAPFASVGGLERRASMKAPTYIVQREQRDYLDGYRFAAACMYGPDWKTCTFGWKPAITIPASDFDGDDA